MSSTPSVVRGSSRRRAARLRRCLLSSAAALGLCAAAPLARAQVTQGYAVDRFDPAPIADTFFAVQRPGVDGKFRFSGGLVADYAHAPLVLRDTTNDQVVGRIISRRFVVHASVSLAIVDRILLTADLPTVVSDGNSPVTPSGTRFASPDTTVSGDARFSLRIRLFGGLNDPFQIAIAGSMWGPTGSQDQYTSDGKVRGMPQLIVGGVINDFIAWDVNAGLMFRPSKAGLDASTLEGKELDFGAAVGVLAAKQKIVIGPELYGGTIVESGASAFGKKSTNLELLFGVHYRPSPWVFGIGAGPGLTTAAGTPDWRVVATLGLASWGEEPPPAKPKDRDHDGIVDDKDACPDVPGVASDDPKLNGCPPPKPSDKDGDGIVDAKDACPELAGVANDDPKKNGCPPDKDNDGIYDKDDACPDVAGVASDDPKKNGCPPDKDGDGIADAEDACPDVPGVKDPDPKKNGCPPDKDGDGITDDKDACPDQPGPASEDPKKNGCPLVVLTAKAIEINEQVHFEFNKARILADSDALLTAVAQVLKDHPEIKKISIEGHTDNKGAPAYNMKLSQQRADAVMKWLADHGVEKKRMSAKGFGQTKPIADNKTDEGREKNRRVEFKILEKDEAAAAPAPGGAPTPTPAPAPTPKP